MFVCLATQTTVFTHFCSYPHCAPLTGATIGTQLALPLLQERLDVRALEFAAQRAKIAESEVIRMEVRSSSVPCFYMRLSWHLLLRANLQPESGVVLWAKKRNL